MIKKRIKKKHNPMSSDHLFDIVKNEFEKIEDHRPMNVEIELSDILMSGFSLFSLKSPSLLAFEHQRQESEGNLKQIYGIDRVPSDTQMRKVLDNVEPSHLRGIFKGLREHAQEHGILQRLKYEPLAGYYLVSSDGTGYFSSKKIHCEHCLEKKHKKSGEISYSHQMLTSVIVHPEKKEVFPLLSEPIMKQDGETKNDCERNASMRLLSKIREDHPTLPFIFIEDALSSNAPHIKELRSHNMSFILGAKPKGNQFLFKQLEEGLETGETTELEIVDGQITHRFRFRNNVSLNESNREVKVNFLQYEEVKNGVAKRKFAWVTDIVLVENNVMAVMRAGRARWKIENETFNTLKNQGYHFEHNFGHGYRFLTTVFAQLLLLAFTVDQLQQMGCELFQRAWQKAKSKRALWERMRALFFGYTVEFMSDIWRAIADGFKHRLIVYDSGGIP